MKAVYDPKAFNSRVPLTVLGAVIAAIGIGLAIRTMLGPVPEVCVYECNPAPGLKSLFIAWWLFVTGNGIAIVLFVNRPSKWKPSPRDPFVGSWDGTDPAGGAIHMTISGRKHHMDLSVTPSVTCDDAGYPNSRGSVSGAPAPKGPDFGQKLVDKWETLKMSGPLYCEFADTQVVASEDFRVVVSNNGDGTLTVLGGRVHRTGHEEDSSLTGDLPSAVPSQDLGQETPRGTPTRGRSIKWISALGVVALTVAVVAVVVVVVDRDGEPVPPRTVTRVTYTVTGTAEFAQISWAGVAGQIESVRVNLPWRREYTSFEQGDLMYLTAEAEGGGHVECQVSVNGEPRGEDLSNPPGDTVCTVERMNL